VKKRDQNYHKNQVLKTAMEGYERPAPVKSCEYHRQDARKEIEEGLEEFAELIEQHEAIS
jgi:hypothetical protein